MRFNRASEVRHAQEDLQFGTEAFLRRCGWEHDSNTPGCYWLWFKTIDGRAYGCDTAMALSLQAASEPPDEHGETDGE